MELGKKTNKRALEETVYVSIISQISRDSTLSQTVNKNDNIELYLSEIKVHQSLMNQLSCDRCKLMPKFNISASNDGVKSQQFDLVSEENSSDDEYDDYPFEYVSQKHPRANQQIVSKYITQTKMYPVSTENQDHIRDSFIPVHCQISSPTKISLSSKPCCCHKRRTCEAYYIGRQCQKVNVDNVQLVIKCEGVSIVESLVFKI